jgi:hypothetical protein
MVILGDETPWRASGDKKAAATSNQSGNCSRRIFTFHRGPVCRSVIGTG